jgi:hypothetical protein
VPLPAAGKSKSGNPPPLGSCAWEPLHDPLIQGFLLIHFVSVGRLLLLLYHIILLLVGPGDPTIGFGRFEAPGLSLKKAFNGRIIFFSGVPGGLFE